jgi:hypothetical protein
MKLKTYPDYLGLCGSCRHASLAMNVNGEFLARCDWFGWKIHKPIAACSKYDDRRLPSLYDMRRTAWILRTDEHHKAIGFVSNEGWRKSKEFRDDPYWDDENS